MPLNPTFFADLILQAKQAVDDSQLLITQVRNSSLDETVIRLLGASETNLALSEQAIHHANDVNARYPIDSHIF